MKSGNVAFKRMESVGWVPGEDAMTIEGTAAKAVFLFLPLLTTAFLVWSKYMEWYCAFSLLVTLIWFYVEALRLLKKLKGN